MKINSQNNIYGAFELKKNYGRNYTIGVSAAIVMHLIIFIAFVLLFPNQEENNSVKEKLSIITYVDLGPPPSIIPNEVLIPAPAKPTFGTIKIAKKGEEVMDFEIPKDSKPVGNVVVEASKPVEKKPIPIDETYYVAVDVMPEPFGGMEALQKKVNYPAKAKEESIVGKVFVKAFINELGEVARTEIVKGLGYGCDEEADWAVKSTRFKPGKKNGKNVRVQLTIPLTFRPI